MGVFTPSNMYREVVIFVWVVLILTWFLLPSPCVLYRKFTRACSKNL